MRSLSHEVGNSPSIGAGAGLSKRSKCKWLVDTVVSSSIFIDIAHRTARPRRVYCARRSAPNLVLVFGLG